MRSRPISALLMITALAVLAPVQAIAAGEECPANLEQLGGMTRAETKAALRYARCIRIPSLPVADQLEPRKAACSTLRVITSSARLNQAFAWIDHIASQFPGCETRLGFKRR